MIGCAHYESNFVLDGQRPHVFHDMGFVHTIDKDHRQEYRMVLAKDQKTKDYTLEPL
jgi:hypothetical protein